MEGIKFPNDRIEILIKKYSEKYTKIRKVLSNSSFSFPHITDVEWRLDYFVKSDTLEKMNRPVYFLKLKTRENGGKNKDIEFACTLEQLQDLVNKLKDAEHSLSRINLS